MKHSFKVNRHLIGTFLCVAGFAAAALMSNVVSGVAVIDVLKYWAYVALIIILPGFAVASWICPRDSFLFRVTSGIAIGFAIEILGFLTLASLGLKSWTISIPIIVAGIAFAAIKRRNQRDGAGYAALFKGEVSLIDAGVILAIYAGVLFTLWITFNFTQPLPDVALAQGAEQTWVHPSLLSHMGDASEIKLRWPIQDIRISGRPYFYHYFAFVHTAAASTVTGVGILEIMLRLTLSFMTLAILWQIYSIGRELFAHRGVALMTVAGTAFLSASFAPPGEYIDTLYYDPGHTMGMVLFLPAIVYIIRILSHPEGKMRQLALLGLLVVVMSGTKAIILPVLVVGMTGWLGLVWLRRRHVELKSVAVLLLVLAIGFAFSFLYLQPDSTQSGSQWIEPFFHIRDSSYAFLKVYPRMLNVIQTLTGHIPLLASTLSGIAWFGSLLLELGRRYLPALPAVYVLWWGWRNEKARRPLLLWLAMLFVGGSVFAYSMANWWFGEIKFLYYGDVGLMLLVSYGLVVLWRQRHRKPLAEVALFVSLVAISAVVWQVLDLYGRRAIYRVTETRVVSGALTKNLNEGLQFLRDHTPVDAVIAVNRTKYALDSGTTTHDGYLFYSGLSHRRIYFEGWDETGIHQVYLAKKIRELKKTIGRQQAVYEARRRAPNHFPKRTAVIRALLDEKDPQRFGEIAAENGINYLLVDKLHGELSYPPSAAVINVFENSDVAIYEIQPLDKLQQMVMRHDT